ncbi:MAG: ArdC-like ssDNA-binding domain-containing protein [Culicoidibacterales bacterium]
MAFKQKTPLERQQEITTAIDTMNEQIESYYRSPEAMQEFLEFMGNFRQYSVRNQALIQSQYRGALAVAPFQVWKKEHEANVLKGQKGIQILVPAPYTLYTLHDGSKVTQSSASEAQKKAINGKNYVKEEQRKSFKIGHVFDIKQTDYPVEKYPEFYPMKQIGGDLNNYAGIKNALETLAFRLNVKLVSWNPEFGTARGVCFGGRNEIALNPTNTQQEHVLTFIHELAHARLHNCASDLPTALKEYQAEMVSYAVASYFGFEHEMKTVEYLGEWCSQADIRAKTDLIQEVAQTVNVFIDFLEDDLAHELGFNSEKETEASERENEEDNEME